MADADEFVPGTRFPIICPSCKRRRRRLDDIRLVACGCISSHWLRLYECDDGQTVRATP